MKENRENVPKDNEPTIWRQYRSKTLLGGAKNSEL